MVNRVKQDVKLIRTVILLSFSQHCELPVPSQAVPQLSLSVPSQAVPQLSLPVPSPGSARGFLPVAQRAQPGVAAAAVTLHPACAEGKRFKPVENLLAHLSDLENSVNHEDHSHSPYYHIF